MRAEAQYAGMQKGGETLTKKFDIPGITLKVSGKTIEVNHVRANRKDIAIIKTVASHIRNLFRGLETGFVYHMEICNVHFPMTVKIEGSKLIINNFLGEKEKRFASIVPGVKVDVKSTSRLYFLELTLNQLVRVRQTLRKPHGWRIEIGVCFRTVFSSPLRMEKKYNVKEIYPK